MFEKGYGTFYDLITTVIRVRCSRKCRRPETEGTETVELTVWGEKDNTATLTKMIDSRRLENSCIR